MKDLRKELMRAVDICDFEAMISLLKQGVPTEKMVIHKVIAKDRADLLDYLLFSKEIPNNFPLHYDYPNIGQQPALLYACVCCAFNVVSYLLNNEKVSILIDFKRYTQEAFQYTVINQDARLLELLLTHHKTKDFIHLEKDIKYIQISISRSCLLQKYDALEYLIEKSDINFAAKIISLINSESIYHQNLFSMYEKRLFNEKIIVPQNDIKPLKI